MGQKILLIVDGGSRSTSSVGYGSYVVIMGNRRTITHLEFGSSMTPREAEYDTLIMALQTLIQQIKPAGAALEIQTPSLLLVNQIRGVWEARDSRMRIRRDRALEMLHQFESFSLQRISREQSARVMIP